MFCRATFSPPTMTIVAFALRLADTIDRRLRTKGSLPDWSYTPSDSANLERADELRAKGSLLDWSYTPE